MALKKVLQGVAFDTHVEEPEGKWNYLCFLNNEQNSIAGQPFELMPSPLAKLQMPWPETYLNLLETTHLMGFSFQTEQRPHNPQSPNTAKPINPERLDRP